MNKKGKKISLLRYWTTRYLITLVLGLIVVGILSVIWLRQTNLEHRLDMTRYLGQEISDRFVETQSGQMVPQGGIFDYIEQRQGILDTELDPIIYIVDRSGRILSNPLERNPFSFEVFPVSLLKNKGDVQRIQLSSGEESYLVKTPIEAQGGTAGWVVVIQSAGQLTQMNEEYRLLAIMLVSLALIGWAVIYVLSKRLSRPIQDVATAARHVQEQDYDFTLPSDIKEREVHELVHSFREMSGRLQELERLRMELLAGVTHELKTPVTSMTGLIQAVRDDVVSGDEAKEFLDVSLNEANRMQTMVADLLEFNSFSAHTVPISTDTYNLNTLLTEIIHQWEVANDEDSLLVSLHTLEKPVFVNVDSMRLQQIIVNLMNNAKQALNEEGTIDVRLYNKDDDMAGIDIVDNGPGISEDEQYMIFERFYRGENKKYNTHGLGLGLPFSKIIARSMSGDLVLTESRKGRTVFTLEVPKHQE
ncbi:HAMP domain-containing sensor histidine kinase [Salibacterium halotolerans]|uniref:histidine kinase n=1 Tax=Salibacterium halotolerans TaxID=1884432 RepID=A0A1I5LFL0_9BACI|nr:HAMP domain-containing sensor histidine kinase [Salibacterium halotolerans]SFO96149.1 Signal transduction histidine kinase [Salibacterium halotolerans]